MQEFLYGGKMSRGNVPLKSFSSVLTNNFSCALITLNTLILITATEQEVCRL